MQTNIFGKDVLAIFILIGAWFSFKLVHYIFSYFILRVNTYDKFHGIRINNYKLIKKHHQLHFTIAILEIIKSLLKLGIIILTLFLIFSLFDITRPINQWVIDFLILKSRLFWNHLVAYLPNLLNIFLIILVFRFVLQLLRFVKDQILIDINEIPTIHHAWVLPTYYIVKFALYILGLIVIFPYLPGAGSPVFNGISIFAGILITVGSSGSFNNVIAGLALTYMNAFKNGDRIKTGDIYGDILNKNLLVTKIKTIKNEVISIPNANLLNSHIINYSKDFDQLGVIVHSTISIGYDVPWETVHDLCIKAALDTQYIEAEPAPFIYQLNLDDFYINYQVNAYTKYPNDLSVIYSELHKNILNAFREANVEILSPHFISLRNGNKNILP